jgi:hypothetical protein
MYNFIKILIFAIGTSFSTDQSFGPMVTLNNNSDIEETTQLTASASATAKNTRGTYILKIRQFNL